MAKSLTDGILLCPSYSFDLALPALLAHMLDNHRAGAATARGSTRARMTHHLVHVWRKQLKPIGTCQGWPASDLYLETTTNKTFPYANSTAGQSKNAGALQAAGSGSGSVSGSSSGNGTASSGAMSSGGAGVPGTVALVLAGIVAACGVAF
jgi:uncharacterized membrane protein YgcG